MLSKKAVCEVCNGPIPGRVAATRAFIPFADALSLWKSEMSAT